MNLFIVFFILAILATGFVKYHFEERYYTAKPIFLNEHDRRLHDLCNQAGIPREDWRLGDEVAVPMQSGDTAIYELSEITYEGKPAVTWYTLTFVRYAALGDNYYPAIANKAWWTK